MNVEQVKNGYPAGTLVVLDSLEDHYAKKDMQPGLKGKVVCVDDAGTVHIQWDNGRTIGIIPGVDCIHKA